MITVRPAETDADLEAWIHVRRTVLPKESAGTVELVRARTKPESLLLLAELDGELAGSGIAGRGDIRERAFVAPRVLPDRRRRGIGTALLRRLGEHAMTLGVDKVGGHVDDPGSQAFAERFGFREVGRQVEQVRVLGEEQAPPTLPESVEVVTLAKRPDLLEAAHTLACEGYADMATDGLAQIDLEDWLRDEGTLPEGSFVALAGGEIVGYAGLVRHDNEGVAEDGLTVVRRDWRRRGLGSALKQREISWAAANGFREIVTWTQRGNEGMRAVNVRLDYVYRDVAVTLVAPLPLPV